MVKICQKNYFFCAKINRSKFFFFKAKFRQTTCSTFSLILCTMKTTQTLILHSMCYENHVPLKIMIIRIELRIFLINGSVSQLLTKKGKDETLKTIMCHTCSCQSFRPWGYYLFIKYNLFR